MRFILVLLLGLILGTAVSFGAGITPAVTIPGAIALSFIPQPQGVSLMAVQKEIWTDYIIKNLFKNNKFLQYAFDESQYVLNGKVVHIPQAGAPSNVKRNRQTLPATITQRSDVDITYPLDEFTTDPRFIPDADKVELSYDKIASVLEEDMANLGEIIAEWMLYKWRPEGSQIIRTTGNAVPAHVGIATGNRKAFTIDDLKKAKLMFNKQNIPLGDRYAVIDSDMMSQLTASLSATDYKDFSREYDAKTGTVGKLESFLLIERSTVLVANNASTPQILSPLDNIPTTGNGVVLCYHKTAVAKALGDTKMFDNVDDPTYYGDIYSFLQRMGGRKRRKDLKGVVGIVQDHA